MAQKFHQLFILSLIFSFFIGVGLSELSFGDNDLESPRKQLENEIDPKEVQCKPNHMLVILQSDKLACLSKTTFLKLEERGYIKSVIKEFVHELPKIKKEFIAATANVSSGSTIKGDTGKTSTAEITNIPASKGSIINFYITDHDLNTSPNGVDIVDVTNLLEFSINGVPIKGPQKMTETGFDTGQFYVKLHLPDSINEKSLSQDDIIEIKYLDESDVGGDPLAVSTSIPLSHAYAQIQTSGGGKTRIGHEFTVRIYEPDANLDSRDVNRIPLSKIEYRGEGGIRTTLHLTQILLFLERQVITPEYLR